jgi:hypothetical protein
MVRAEGAQRGSVINARTFIGSMLALSAMVVVISTMNLTKRPVLGVPLRAPQAVTAPTGKLEADRQPIGLECSSTAFLDYAAGTRGPATPQAAVRSYRPDAGDLRIQSLERNLAVVEELRGGTRVAVYEVFRVKSRGWLVGQAVTFTPCDAGP